jgi:hypothetical protein
VNEVRSWVAERLPADEDLDRAQLRELATALGQRPDMWGHLVRHIPDERYFVELYRDVHVDIWLICWLNHQDTGFHDHDVSQGAVYVCDGVLVEERLRQETDAVRQHARTHPAGGSFDFHASYVHRMRHPGGEPATSIHCYSPALWRLGHYDFDDDGILCRTSITYADEMWTGRVVEARAFEPS